MAKLYKQFHKLSLKNTQGFTLIEVLVASFILFLVIASITLVYRGALLSSGIAERTLIFSSFVEPISEQIRIQIKDAEDDSIIENQGVMGEISFSWSAHVIQQAKAPERLNFTTGELESGVKTYKLWQVKLQLQTNAAKREYQFNEVSW